MSGVFDEEEREAAHPGRDTEVTLGSGAVLAIVLGLVLICGLCFALGYAAGRHGSSAPAEALQPTLGAQTTLQADSARPKPSAIVQTSAAPAQQEPQAGTLSDQPPGQISSADEGNPTGGTQGPGPARQAGPSVPDPIDPLQVRPALAPPANSPLTSQPASSAMVQPALVAAPQTAPLMVQIAAVSHLEDADVLMNALRRRGYAVMANRDGADGLIHVRVGPFTSRDVANQWRQKLLNDGYNAVVQP